MNIGYGHGTYIEGDKKVEGQIILDEHKIFLRSVGSDLVQTFVPLEKIEHLRLSSDGLEMEVRPSLTYRYRALIKGERDMLHEMAREIVVRRNFHKRIFKNEWFEG